MTDRRFIKPAEGRDVRDPAAGNALVPPHGKGVPWDSFWQRRLDDGDVEMTTEDAVTAGEKHGEGLSPAALKKVRAGLGADSNGSDDK